MERKEEYYVDNLGRVWKGYVGNDDNLHWARCHGTDYKGNLIWVLQTSDKPADLRPLPQLPN